MNQAQLRPPQRVAQGTVAFLGIPGVLYLVIACWLYPSLTPLQQMYLWPYAKMSTLGSSGPQKVRDRILYSTMTPDGRQMPAIHSTKDLHGLQPANYQMTAADYAGWLRQYIYGNRSVWQLVRPGLILTAEMIFVLMIPAVYIDRYQHLKFRSTPRHIRGTELVTRARFNKEVNGDGLAWRTENYKGKVYGRDAMVRRSLSEFLTSSGVAVNHATKGEWRAAQHEFWTGEQTMRIQIPKVRESEHGIVCGSNGSGKTSVLLAIADRAEYEGATCIIYDPHRQYIKRYYDPSRGDVVLHTVDARMPSWNPSDEVDYTTLDTARMTALASAASLYPGHPGQRDWFFTDAARRLYVHAMVYYRPDAAQLTHLYTHIDPLIDAITKGTELATMLTENAGPQRAGILAVATQCLPALRQIPPPGAGRPNWSARQWAKERKGWIFLTAKTSTREAMRPLHSMWLDSLILQLIDTAGKPEQPPVYILIDEVQTLQQLPQMGAAVRETRKSGVSVWLGIHAKADLRRLYEEDADTIISAPATKFLLRIGDPEAQDWASKAVGNHEIERLREHVGAKGEKSYTTERTTEPLIMPTEFTGFEPRVGLLRYGNFATQMKVRFAEPRPDKAEDFLQAPGKPSELLPMPSLEAILAQKAEEQKRKEESAAKFVTYEPPEADARKKGGLKKNGGSPGSNTVKQGPPGQGKGVA